MKCIDWFSGIGGFRLGLERAGPFQFVAHSEIDPYAAAVYNRHWPGSLNLGDITRLEPHNIPDADLWTGGIPCQPFSVAGKRAGQDDPRHLWPAFYGLLRVCRPRFVLIENVPGLLADAAFGEILIDLSSAGYDAEWSVIGAHQVGAPHRRDRLWILAYTDEPRPQRRELLPERAGQRAIGAGGLADSHEFGREREQKHAREQGALRNQSGRCDTGRRRDGTLPWPHGWAVDPADVEHAAEFGRGEGQPEPKGATVSSRCGDRSPTGTPGCMCCASCCGSEEISSRRSGRTSSDAVCEVGRAPHRGKVCTGLLHSKGRRSSDGGGAGSLWMGTARIGSPRWPSALACGIRFCSTSITLHPIGKFINHSTQHG